MSKNVLPHRILTDGSVAIQVGSRRSVGECIVDIDDYHRIAEATSKPLRFQMGFPFFKGPAGEMIPVCRYVLGLGPANDDRVYYHDNSKLNCRRSNLEIRGRQSPQPYTLPARDLGDGTLAIPIGEGGSRGECIIDAEDYPTLAAFGRPLAYHKAGLIMMVEGKTRVVARLILGLDARGIVVRYKDGDIRNCRRSNMRQGLDYNVLEDGSYQIPSRTPGLSVVVDAADYQRLVAMGVTSIFGAGRHLEPAATIGGSKGQTHRIKDLLYPHQESSLETHIFADGDHGNLRRANVTIAPRVTINPVMLSDGTAAIPVSGQYVFVDIDDLPVIESLGLKPMVSTAGYVQFNRTRGSDSVYIIQLHRLIMGLSPDDDRDVDHRNGDALDNRRRNLRIGTRTDNLGNRLKTGSATSSQYKGVAWDKRSCRWSAQICIHSKRRSLGLYDDEVDAAHAYDAAARVTFGEFCRVNFPLAGEQGAHTSGDSELYDELASTLAAAGTTASAANTPLPGPTS